MLSFHQIVLRKFLIIFSILFFIVGGIVYYWMKDFYITQTKESLLQEIEIVSFSLLNNDDCDALAHKLKNHMDTRLTVIDQDGTVTCESHKNKEFMDNHKYRAEIMQSDKEKYGYKIRHSKTIDKDLLYIAKKYNNDGKVTYIRLSQKIQDINNEIISLGSKILIALIIFFAAITYITYQAGAKIERETIKIVKFLKSLTRKKKTTYISSDLSREFSDITKLLSKVSQILIKKEKQKSKFTSKLQTANKQKDDIISAISHEFKNPIAVINGYSQTLLDDENLNVSIRKKFLDKIYNNGLKLSSLIDTLRLSIKLDSGKQTLNFLEQNIYEAVVDTAENIKLNYPRREAIVKGDTSLIRKVDATLFSVLIGNLIENAFKYSEDDVIIEVEKEAIKVIDTGIGISKNNLENITNKFYRVHENSWNNSLGLGLFIVSNIVKLHNFTLKIESKENEGSTFSINF